MKKQTKQLIERLKTELSNYNYKVVLISDNENITTLAIVRFNSCEFIVKCSYRSDYGFKEENHHWHLHNITPIDGYISAFIVDEIEKCIEERKDAE